MKLPMYINNQSNSVNQILSESNKISVKTTESTIFSDFMEAMQSSATIKEVADRTSSDSAIFSMDTNKGKVEMNLDRYFEPKHSSSEPVNLLDVPLLLPTALNIDTLAKYSEQKVKDLMQQYKIPKPPATIEFDQGGQLILPSDYPYSTQLKQAFSENPQVEEALRTTSALASHYAGIMESQPFRDEMSTARSQADRDRIVEKYSYLFEDNRPPIQVILSFLDDGSMLVGGRTSTTEDNTMFKISS
jgi:hypothetical protein